MLQLNKKYGSNEWNYGKGATTQLNLATNS